ncbi:MAG: SH3 domain-containing protein [Paracoccus sp. (in: a-proteobacteria)]|nr:SH3 domain-containing protein [Paracoccus sp. (in: a-proteobacteria)]
MFKLIFATLAAIFAVLTIYGDGDGRQLAAAEPQPGAAEAAPASANGAALLPADKPEIITEVVQTEPERPRFAGPALRPSPEFAGAEPPEDQPEPDENSLFVTGNSVNFRAGPTTSDRVIGALTRGTMVTALGGREGEWVQVQDAQGRTGYMAAQFLSETRP